jgi:hypothetical protein
MGTSNDPTSSGENPVTDGAVPTSDTSTTPEPVKPKKSKPAGVRYIGNGSFVVGVPATNLTAEQVAQYGGIDALTRSGLYVKEDDHGVTN